MSLPLLKSFSRFSFPKLLRSAATSALPPSPILISCGWTIGLCHIAFLLVPRIPQFFFLPQGFHRGYYASDNVLPMLLGQPCSSFLFWVWPRGPRPSPSLRRSSLWLFLRAASFPLKILGVIYKNTWVYLFITCLHGCLRQSACSKPRFLTNE